MPVELIVALIALAIPAVTAAVQGSFLGTLIGAAAGATAAYVFIFAPLWGLGVLIAGWIAAGMLGARASRIRREERRHRELLAEMRKAPARD